MDMGQASSLSVDVFLKHLEGDNSTTSKDLFPDDCCDLLIGSRATHHIVHGDTKMQGNRDWDILK